MVLISKLPKKHQKYAYRQFFTQSSANIFLKERKAKSYFKVNKDKRPKWLHPLDWKQTFTLIPIRSKR